MRVLWTHSFLPQYVGSGSFMHTQKSALCDLDIELHYTPYSLHPMELRRQISLLREKAKHFDLIHSQYGSTCGLITSLVKDKKKLITLRGSDWYGLKKGPVISRLRGKVQTLCTKYCLDQYDALITVSQKMHAELAKIFKGPAHVLADGIDMQAFVPMPQELARNLLNCGTDTSVWIGFSTVAGRENPVKRLWLAQRAVSILKEKFSNVSLKIFSGLEQEQMPLVINACNVILLTSVHEGWPNVIKEAMACNVPVVSTDVSDLSTIARVNAACQIAEAEPGAIAIALEKALNLDRQCKLRQHCENMELNKVANDLRNIYQTLIR